MAISVNIDITPAAKAAVLTSPEAQAAVNAKTMEIYSAAVGEAGQKYSNYLGYKLGSRAKKQAHGFVYVKARNRGLVAHMSHILQNHAN